MINACADKILQALKMLDESGKPLFPLEGVNRMLLKQSCCKRACLRGAFLCAGSMSDPKKGYHLEFVCEQEKQAQQIREMIADFELEAKIICRKKHNLCTGAVMFQDTSISDKCRQFSKLTMSGSRHHVFQLFLHL